MLEHTQLPASNPQRTVVIGSGGFVGRNIDNALQASGIETRGITRQDVDLLQPGAAETLAKLLEPGDSVVFVSARAPARNVPQLMENLRMAEAACAAFADVMPGHLLYISSDAVYADDANPVTENSPSAPSSPHGMMHAARELMLGATVTCPYAVLRPTLIYGADDPHSGYGPNRFRRQAANREPIALFGNGEEKRDHISVEDVARLAALMVQHRSAGVLNAVTGVSTSFYDVAALVAQHFSPPAEIKCLPRENAPSNPHRFFDISQCLTSFPEFRYTGVADGIADVHRKITGQE